jgi:hypothetical protein
MSVFTFAIKTLPMRKRSSISVLNWQQARRNSENPEGCEHLNFRAEICILFCLFQLWVAGATPRSKSKELEAEWEKRAKTRERVIQRAREWIEKTEGKF